MSARMLNIMREPDGFRVLSADMQPLQQAQLRFEQDEQGLQVFLCAKEEEPAFVCLRWEHTIGEPVMVLGDAWERSYADLAWKPLGGNIFHPWYFLVSGKKETVGCGVMVQPNSFVSFQVDSRGVTGWFDVRCGGMGVRLGDRELHAATVVCRSYTGVTAFEAAKQFCHVMSPTPVLPKQPVYGSNNWYYAYGKSSGVEIRRDAAVVAQLAAGNSNPPFMVIDDGWQPNPCAGPWIANERYGDMAAVAADFKEQGVRPGIWVRPLRDLQAMETHPEWRLKKGDALTYLDPSHPEVKMYLRELFGRIRSWGYELVKHDFTTVDMFGDYGFMLKGSITRQKNWCFYDRGKTSAEITLELYRLIREAAGGMMILGCNTVSHLCAGLAEINRIGDDTSGREWNRTCAMGVNTLAFRLPQNGAFYMVDADCVGILEQNIPWELNRQWLRLLAVSGSPLFVSAQPSALTEAMKEDLRRAWAINAVQADAAEPLDWMYNTMPEKWRINGSEEHFDWIQEQWPPLLWEDSQRC